MSKRECKFFTWYDRHFPYYIHPPLHKRPGGGYRCHPLGWCGTVTNHWKLSQLLTKSLESRTLHNSYLSYVFDSIYEICNEFDMYKFSYTPRIGNQVAHSLARLALSLENDQYWPSGIPESLIPLVSADFQHVSSF